MRLHTSVLCLSLPFVLATSLALWPAAGVAQGLSDSSNPAEALTQLQQLGRGSGQLGTTLQGDTQQSPHHIAAGVRRQLDAAEALSPGTDHVPARRG